MKLCFLFQMVHLVVFFFVGTGFHGAHVIIGSIFLLKVFINLIAGRLLHCHHASFEFAAWYWHFVDVV